MITKTIGSGGFIYLLVLPKVNFKLLPILYSSDLVALYYYTFEAKSSWDVLCYKHFFFNWEYGVFKYVLRSSMCLVKQGKLVAVTPVAKHMTKSLRVEITWE